MTVKINADTSDGLKFVSDTSGEIDLQIDASTKVHMASDGKVGIGTSSPAHMLHVKAGDSRVRTEETTGSTTFDMTNTSGGHFLDSSGTNDLTINKSGSAGLIMKTANTNRTKIHSDGDINFFKDDGSTVAVKFDASNGNFGIGTSTVSSALHVVDAGATPCIFDITGTTGDIVLLRNGGSTKGTISTNGTSVAYNETSDYRLKENVDYSWDATTRLKQLKPARFNFISDDTNTMVDGFIAHEVSSIVPQAVTGEKDATKDLGTIKDSDGNVIQENVLESEKEDGQTWVKTSTENVYQGIDQSKLVPLLVKTIQELEARITALES